MRALALTNPARLQRIPDAQGRVILALDGLPPEVGHEVLWVLRDCLSGAGRRARRGLSATQADLAGLLRTVHQALTVPRLGLMADGQRSIRWAIADVLPDGPPQWWHCYALREAAQPLSKADRRAKHTRKQRGRSVRPIARRRCRTERSAVPS